MMTQTLPMQTNPPLRLLAAFQSSFPEQVPECILQVTGREMWLAATLTGARHFSLAAPDLGGGVTVFSYQSVKLRRTVTNRPLPNWARYPAGVMAVMLNLGMEMDGVMAAVIGEEPSGPRYEYAMGMVFAALWFEAHAQPYTTATLIEIVDRVRREFGE